MTTSPWLTTDQVAAHYQLPVTTIRQRIRTGRIRARNFGTDRKQVRTIQRNRAA